jgi:hypothetical protein
MIDRRDGGMVRAVVAEIQGYLIAHEQDYLPVQYWVTETLAGELWVFTELNPLLEGFFRSERVEELAARLKKPVYCCRRDGFHLAVMVTG